MGDIFEKMHETDEKGIDKNDSFIDKSLEDHKKVEDMIKSILPDKTDSTFSSDLNIFSQACTKFINYIKQCVENPDEVYVLYMLRDDNSIDYGRYKQCIKKKKDTIEMISNEDLRNIIEEIPMDKLDIIVNKAGNIIKNSKENKDMTFNIDNVKRFISFCVDTILGDLDSFKIYITKKA